MTPQPMGCFNDVTRLWTLGIGWRCRTRAGWLGVKAGMDSDGASVPRFFWSWVSPEFDLDTFPAAFAHDCLYAGELCARELADWTFYDILKERKLSAWKIWAMTYAVRKCGGVVWKSHTPESRAKALQYCRLFSTEDEARYWAASA